MRHPHTFFCIDAHTCGNPVRVVAGGAPPLPHVPMAEKRLIFLAEQDEAVVGILRCVESIGSPLLEPARYAYVSSVYVRPEARRHGVLRALMKAAEAWSRARGLEQMRLHNVSGSPSAEGAWSALGFEVVEHVRVRSVPSATG